MTKELVLQAIENNKKGAFINVEYETTKKPLAKHKDSIIKKHSKGVYRLGIDYKNMAVNKDKQTGPMLYGAFEIKNYLIEYNGKYYLRVYVSHNHKTESQWTLNGEKVSKQYLIDNGYISNTKSQPVECFNISIENIIKIGN